MTGVAAWTGIAAAAAMGAVFLLVSVGAAWLRATPTRFDPLRSFSVSKPEADPLSAIPAPRALAARGRDARRPPGRRGPAAWAVGVSLVAGTVGLVVVPPWGVLSAVPAGVGMALWRRARARSQAAKLQPQVLQALDLIAATVKAGFGFVQAIELASREIAEPMASELRIALHEIELGVSVDDALRSLSARVADRDLSLAISALLIQRRVGGGLYQILHNIADLIRDRSSLEGEIRSLTAQARLSARVVGLLPVAIAGMMALIQPSYIEVLVMDPIGRLLIAVAVGSELVGFWAISRLARIDF